VAHESRCVKKGFKLWHQKAARVKNKGFKLWHRKSRSMQDSEEFSAQRLCAAEMTC
jgi:hypothetical protein